MAAGGSCNHPQLASHARREEPEKEIIDPKIPGKIWELQRL